MKACGEELCGQLEGVHEGEQEGVPVRWEEPGALPTGRKPSGVIDADRWRKPVLASPCLPSPPLSWPLCVSLGSAHQQGGCCCVRSGEPYLGAGG